MSKPSSARLYTGTARNVSFLARKLAAGELVAVPTETVYGLAANALDAHACAKIFRAKGRPVHDPLIVHVHSSRQIDDLAFMNEAAVRLAKKFWPGPLTIILRKRPAVPNLVTSGRDSVAIRMPGHALFRRLLKAVGVPLAAPSANPFGYISPTSAKHVFDSLGTRIRYILDGGPARIGLESTIVDLRHPTRPILLRPGYISEGAIQKALGSHARLRRTRPRERLGPQLAPGQMKRHYSPRTPVVLHQRLELPTRVDSRHAYLFLRKPRGADAKTHGVYWLDPRGSLPGAARRLFATMRHLDGLGYRVIHVELARGGGLADAINDRLRRAAAAD